MEKLFTINAEKLSVRCKAYYDEWKTPQTVLLYGHGFGGSKDAAAAEHLAKRILEKNKRVLFLCFDWPCHGEDALKKLSLDACDAYLRLVLEHVEETWAPERLLGCAASFGGYLFLRCIAAHGDPFERLALRCPAIPMYEVLTGKVLDEAALEKLRKGKPASAGFDRKIEITPAFLAELRSSDLQALDWFDFADELLILHGTEDELIPFDAVAAFAEDNCIELIPVEGADHRFRNPKHADFAIAQMLEFFELR